MKLLNEKDRELNTKQFQIVLFLYLAKYFQMYYILFLDKMLGQLIYLYSSGFRNIEYPVSKNGYDIRFLIFQKPSSIQVALKMVYKKLCHIKSKNPFAYIIYFYSFINPSIICNINNVHTMLILSIQENKFYLKHMPTESPSLCFKIYFNQLESFLNVSKFFGKRFYVR